VVVITLPVCGTLLCHWFSVESNKRELKFSAKLIEIIAGCDSGSQPAWEPSTKTLLVFENGSCVDLQLKFSYLGILQKTSYRLSKASLKMYDIFKRTYLI